MSNKAELNLGPGRINTIDSRRQRYIAYIAQIRCLYRELDHFLARLAGAGVLDRAIILVHSDHGSRIGLMDAIPDMNDDLSDQDVIDHFSTLYAVKRPGVPGRYDRTTRSIQALFAEEFLGRRLSPERRAVALVDLPSGRLVWRALPESGRNGAVTTEKPDEM